MARELLLFRIEEAKKIRSAKPEPYAGYIRTSAEKAMKQGPWTVTAFKSPAPSGDPHDFFSEGPYWWPDPKNPKGPYIRRDGERNPDRFTAHDDAMNNVCRSVSVLGTAAYLFNEKRYSEKAAEILRVFFVDSETRMAPHLEYGQAIRGRNNGRGAGIIETRPMVNLMQGVRFLEESGFWPEAEAKGVKTWYASFINWLLTSKHGKAEAKSGNNHSSWYNTQLASYADFVGDEKTLKRAFTEFREYLIPTQVQPNGSCPREEERTKSLSYSAMNLDALTALSRIGQMYGQDMWSVEGIGRAVEYLLPYVADPSKWKKQQIEPFHASDYAFPAIASVGVHAPEYGEVFRKATGRMTEWRALAGLLLESNS